MISDNIHAMTNEMTVYFLYRVAQPSFRMSLYIFDILLYYNVCLCTIFLWHLRFGWLLVLSLYKEDYLQILNVCPFDYTAIAVSGKVERW